MNERYTLTIGSEDQGVAGNSATALADTLREVDGVLEADRTKMLMLQLWIWERSFQ